MATQKSIDRKEAVLAFLKKSRSKKVSYTEVAEEVGTIPRAVGQILRSLENDGYGKLTKKVVSKAELN
jgi:predicted ArsR family transcriptional regulator